MGSTGIWGANFITITRDRTQCCLHKPIYLIFTLLLIHSIPLLMSACQVAVLWGNTVLSTGSLAVIIDYIYPYTVHLPSYKVHFHRIYLTGTRMILTSPCKFLVTRINKNLARFCIILQDHKYKQDHTRSGKIPVWNVRKDRNKSCMILE